MVFVTNAKVHRIYYGFFAVGHESSFHIFDSYACSKFFKRQKISITIIKIASPGSVIIDFTRI